MSSEKSAPSAPVDAVVMRTMTYADLAKLMHDAEGTDDDLTFMAVADEVFVHRKTSPELWREFYNAEWHRRMARC